MLNLYIYGPISKIQTYHRHENELHAIIEVHENLAEASFLMTCATVQNKRGQNKTAKTNFVFWK